MADKKQREKSRGRKRRNNNHALIAALRHPLRRQILRLMSDGRKASPSELTRELGEPLSTVAYHVRVLAERGALREDGEQQVRGAKQHFYTWAVKEAWVKGILEADEEKSR